MIVRPLLFTAPDSENEATGDADATSSSPHLELVPGAGSVEVNDSEASDREATDREANDRTAQLARLGLLVQEIGATEVLARLQSKHNDVAVASLRQWAREWITQAELLMQSKATIDGKTGALGKFFWWLDTNGCPSCGKAEIERFLAYVTTSHESPGGRWGRGDANLDPEAARFIKPVSARTIKYYRNHLRAFFAWLESKEYIGQSPVVGIPVAKQAKPLIQPFSDDQFEALIKAARKSEMPRRDEAIFTFMYDTGVRASELCNLRLNDLEFKQLGGRVKLLGKGNKQRIVPFQRRTKTLLWNYLLQAPRNGSEKIFIAERGWRKGSGLTRSGLLQLFERTGRAAGITGVRCSPHTMRHTFAIRFLNNGGNIRTLSYLLGHESLHMTMKYLQISEADADKQHQQFSPADALEF